MLKIMDMHNVSLRKIMFVSIFDKFDFQLPFLCLSRYDIRKS